MVDLGWHRLKDIDQPEHILQLTAPDLPTAFPALSGTAERMREVAGIPMTTPDRVLLERALGPARTRVPARVWECEVSAGRQMTQIEALTLARQPLDT